MTTTSTLTNSIRRDLYAVREGAGRAAAVTAIAAAAAEQTFRYADDLPEYWNDVGGLWRQHLGHVWRFLGGDVNEHYYLSRALAEFLVSPLNHVEGQDGPSDFDRPWTVATYAAVTSAVAWGVDFATIAAGQVFECIDLKYDGEYSSERRDEVVEAVQRLGRVAVLATQAASASAQGWTMRRSRYCGPARKRRCQSPYPVSDASAARLCEWMRPSCGRS